MTTSFRPLILLWMLGAGLCLWQPVLGLLVFGASVWKYQGLYREAGRHIQHADNLGAHGLALGLAAFAILWLQNPPAPADDLLRHVPAYAYGYSHTAIFPHSSLPNFNLYPAFDYALGALAQQIGEVATVQLTLALVWMIAIGVVVRLAIHLEGRITAGAALLICLLFATSLSNRLFLGRPEVLCAIWGAAAFLCADWRSRAIWLVSGMALSACYWLFPVYVVFALLVPATWRTRVLMGAALGFFHFGFWSWHAGGLDAYIAVIGMIPEWTRERLFKVNETTSIVKMFVEPAIVLLGLGAMTGIGRHKSDLKVVLGGLGLLFLMTNMVRYSAVMALLFYIAALPLAGEFNQFAKKHIGAALLTLMLPVLVATQVHGTANTLGKLPRFTLPEHAVVLTAFDLATFSLPLFNPGKVQIIPAMEVGATAKAYQRAAADLSKGKVNCNSLRHLDVTHVVEDSLTEVPACLRLSALQKEWRLWEVRHD